MSYKSLPNEDPDLDIHLDHDDDDDDDDNEEEVNTTQPFQPRASSTPYTPGAAYHPGEAHEMTHLSQEQSGGGETIPEAPEYTDFADKEPLLERFREQLKARFPKVDLSKIVLGLGTKKGLIGKVVALGKRGGEVSIFKEDGNITKAFESQFGSFLGPPAKNIIAEDNTALRDTQRRLDEAQQAEARLNAQAQKQEQETQKRQRKETQLEQINQRLANMEDEGGYNDGKANGNRQAETGKCQAHERHQGSKEAGKGICTNSKRTRQGGKRS